jgi:A/G-specific adenine glycosylase
MHPFRLQPATFAHTVITWQQQHGRHDLPWQQEPTPYRVLVSEIMLQQTQVTTVIPYFQRWMDDFPTIETLAAATEEQVMAHWQGLGYYSRARNLHKAACYLVEQCHSEFPASLEGLQTIPGVGRYTAGAIAAFARNMYGPIVDGNVKRLFCRIFAIDGDPASTAVTRQLWQLAEDLTPQEQNRAFAQGLLDLGATLCTPKTPDCPRCPFLDTCMAFQQDRISELPTPKQKKNSPVRSGFFLWCNDGQTLLLEKRPSPGIWGGLWCLPEVSESPASGTLLGRFKHTFSHYKLNASIWTHREPNSAQHGQRFTAEQLATIGLPAPIRTFIEQHFS